METLLILFCIALLLPAIWFIPMIIYGAMRFIPILLFIGPPFVGYVYCVYWLYSWLQPYAEQASNWYLILFVPLFILFLSQTYGRILKGQPASPH